MRAWEFINEGKRKGKIPDAFNHAATEMDLFRDEGIDRSYTLNRVMMAAAMHDGKGAHPVDMDASSFAEKYNTASPYTRQEADMLKGALKTVGGKHKNLVNDPKSKELADTYTASPVVGFKGYPRKGKK